MTIARAVAAVVSRIMRTAVVIVSRFPTTVAVHWDHVVIVLHTMLLSGLQVDAARPRLSSCVDEGAGVDTDRQPRYTADVAPSYVGTAGTGDDRSGEAI